MAVLLRLTYQRYRTNIYYQSMQTSKGACEIWRDKRGGNKDAKAWGCIRHMGKSC